MKDIKIKDLPCCEQPYEKYRQRGENALSDAELLAVILRSGVRGLNVKEISSRIIKMCELKGGIGYLNRISEVELKSIEGIGEVKAAQIKCLAELCKRMWEQSRGQLKKYNCPNDIAAFYLQNFKGLDKEEIILILLDSRNHIIYNQRISLGSSNSTLLSSREVYREALKYNANGVVVIHNHPSGDPKPSIEDKIVTKKLQRAGELIGIELLDHIIIGDGKYYSFREADLV